MSFRLYQIMEKANNGVLGKDLPPDETATMILLTQEQAASLVDKFLIRLHKRIPHIGHEGCIHYPDKFKHCMAFDLDGTVIEHETKKPIKEMVLDLEWMNFSGIVHITIFTGRREHRIKETLEDLERARIPYHEVVMGRRWYSLYIDDKAMSPADYCNG